MQHEGQTGFGVTHLTLANKIQRICSDHRAKYPIVLDFSADFAIFWLSLFLGLSSSLGGSCLNLDPEEQKRLCVPRFFFR